MSEKNNEYRRLNEDSVKTELTDDVLSKVTGGDSGLIAPPLPLGMVEEPVNSVQEWWTVIQDFSNTCEFCETADLLMGTSRGYVGSDYTCGFCIHSRGFAGVHYCTVKK